ncbi:ABC transporter substrate-binding protein [Beggiatoa leptomitoformis]|uniref:ABC transporter substrate-binding protein n=1 Tax=Beggiatoa leptomitoformis TaxID=288004 RepID=A0A2N9YGY0_9GAMM|nr:ABC transporter substrate-binding protein [Beggiatoa leptomitoformis]ALG67944.1 ABC transporter substrate-binding protein [Beggiatoa leptomitoformis]AUI69782.1 ABC transporter substrate-binding protein [Beggiatoa leptomitoformis]
MNNLRFLIIFLLSLYNIVLYADETVKPFKIYMVVWRGETEVDIGFRDYFKNNKIPAEFIVRDMNRDSSKFPDVIAEIKQTKPDLVYAVTTPVTLGLVGKEKEVKPEKHITDIPVVFTLVTDAVSSGIVANNASSGRNITGTSHVAPLETQLNTLISYKPFKRLGVIYNEKEQNSVIIVQELRAQAKKLNFELVAMAVPLDAAEQPLPELLPDLVEKMAREKVDYLYIGPDSFVAGANADVLTRTALLYKLPTFTATEQSVRKADAMIGLVSGYYSLGQFTAYKAEQILVEKIPPQEIPIETLKRFSFIINMKIATALKAYPPLPVIQFAEVINVPTKPAN